MISSVLLAAALLLSPPAQDIASNPVLKALQGVGTSGLSAKAAPASSPTRFKSSSSSSSMDSLLEMFLDDAEERKTVGELTQKLVGQFEDQMKAQGLGGDVSGAAAFATTIFAAVLTEKEVTDEGFLALAKALQASVDRPEVRDATDAQKQQVYELCLLTASIVLVASSSEAPDAQKAAKGVAGAMLQVLLGSSTHQLKVEGGKVRIAAKPAAPPPSADAPKSDPPPATSGLAPSFAYSMPAGWFQRDGWLIREKVESRWEGHREVVSAQVRFLPAIPAKGNMGTALGELWKVNIPAEGADKMSAMVYRRYVGDRVLAQFVSATMREKGRDCDSAFTLMLLDCKTHWQPLVIASTYDENTQIRSGINMMATSSFPEAADLAEEMLRTFRCPPAKNSPIATVESLAGDYSYGTTSTLWTENIYTGATSMNFVAYGGQLNLKPNGTFTWQQGSATGRDATMKHNLIKATGRWSIQGDLLHVIYDTYDQGDTYKVKDKKYKIAGLAVFPSGEKVAVLLYDINKPVNATTVGDKGDWYSTKKK